MTEAIEMNDEPTEQLEVITDTAALGALNKSEIDQQIATARRYPRSIERFRKDVLRSVTLNEQIAGECIYALPRGNKVIEGPSARFAEIAVSAWGNSRAGARVIGEDAAFVTAQGAFFDLEKNVAVTYEVRRRITDSKGKRYNADMIAVTANAACSIALRNAILKGVPKAFWSDLYDEARRCAAGDAKSLSTKRAAALKAFSVYGVTPERIFASLEIGGVEDMTLDHLVQLRGRLTAIKEGEISPEAAFPLTAEGDQREAHAEAAKAENKGEVVDVAPPAPPADEPAPRGKKKAPGATVPF